MTTTVVPISARYTARVEYTTAQVEQLMQHPADAMTAIIEEHITPQLVARGVPEPIDPRKVVQGSSVLAWNDPATGNRVIVVTFPHPLNTPTTNEANPMHGLHIRIEDGPLAGRSTILAVTDPDCIEVDYHPGSDPVTAQVLTGQIPEGRRIRYCRTGFDLATGQWTYEQESPE